MIEFLFVIGGFLIFVFVLKSIGIIIGIDDIKDDLKKIKKNLGIDRETFYD